MSEVKGHWQYLIDTRRLPKGKPAKSYLNGKPVVIVPRGASFDVFEDRCPHRNYPLSEGRLTSSGELVCSYHGWKFDAQGELCDRPGLMEKKPPRFCLKRYPVALADGVLFVVDPEPGKETPPLPQWLRDLQDPAWNSFRYVENVSSRKIALLENLLDPFHTHFVHVPFLRADHDRHLVDVTAKLDAGSRVLELTYTGEPKPSGLISRVLEKDRQKTVGRYVDPDAAVLEYWSSRGLDLRVTLAVADKPDGRCEGILVFQSPRTWYFGLMKPLFRLFTGFLVKQDFRTLEVQEQCQRDFPDKDAWVSTEDYVYKAIQKMRAGQKLDDFERQYQLRI
ncbi:MAG: Rieske 2Fe-2S domain-containing protein [Bdellovibrionaceae bacterium]|nr:Rieske 2Fe-2S domain-containing protein [Pseudobdellovibrionaceae bacterium]